MTWVKMPVNVHMDIGYFGYLDHLACGDATHCLVFGSSSQSLVYGPTIMYSTSDGSRSWQRDMLPRVAKGQLLTVVAVACPSSTTCVASGEIKSENFQKAVVLTSHNGGRSWRMLSLPTPSPLAS
jgi:photosystem II stability/assembly factor-like uncharacterized protein